MARRRDLLKGLITLPLAGAVGTNNDYGKMRYLLAVLFAERDFLGDLIFDIRRDLAAVNKCICRCFGHIRSRLQRPQ